MMIMMMTIMMIRMMVANYECDHDDDHDGDHDDDHDGDHGDDDDGHDDNDDDDDDDDELRIFFIGREGLNAQLSREQVARPSDSGERSDARPRIDADSADNTRSRESCSAEATTATAVDPFLAHFNASPSSSRPTPSSWPTSMPRASSSRPCLLCGWAGQYTT